MTTRVGWWAVGVLVLTGCATLGGLLPPAPGQGPGAGPEARGWGWLGEVLGSDLAAGAAAAGGPAGILALALARAAARKGHAAVEERERAEAAAARERCYVLAIEGHGDAGIKREVAARAREAGCLPGLHRAVQELTAATPDATQPGGPTPGSGSSGSAATSPGGGGGTAA